MATMKSNQSVAYAIDTERETIAFTVAGHPVVTLDMSLVSNAVMQRAAYVGMAQVRIVDTAAVAKTDKDGNIISESERNATKYANIKRLVEHYATGTEQWDLPRVARAPAAPPSVELLTEAMARACRTDAEGVARIVRLSVASRGGDYEANLRYLASGKRVLTALAEIRAERSPRAVDADEALEEFLATQGE